MYFKLKSHGYKILLIVIMYRKNIQLQFSLLTHQHDKDYIINLYNQILCETCLAKKIFALNKYLLLKQDSETFIFKTDLGLKQKSFKYY